MGFLGKLFGKNKDKEHKIGGMEDYMTLVRVYLQAAIADFFKELDQSIRRNCRKMQDVQTYLIQFQNFTQDVMMLTGNLMKFKLRMPSFMKKAIYTMTEKTVSDIFNKNDFKDAGVMKTIVAIRTYNKRLGFSEKWITGFVYQVVMLAKKEPRPNSDETEK